MRNPIEADVESIGDQNTQSDLMYNPKVFLLDEARGLLTIPVYHWGGDTDEHKAEELNGMMVFGMTKEAIDYKGTITNPNNRDYYRQLERAVFIGDVFISVSYEGIQSNKMDGLELIDSLEY